MEDLGPKEAGSMSYSSGVTASGLVGGGAFDSTGVFAYTSSGDGKPMKRFYNISGSTNGINDLGQLTGFADFPVSGGVSHAYLWKNDGSPLLDLGTLRSDTESEGNALNASGQVAGISYSFGVTVFRAFVWKNDGTPMLDLGTLGGDYSYASFINASGQVAGTSSLPKAIKPAGTIHAFFWRNDGTPMQDLGTLAGVKGQSTVSGLNDSGQVVGWWDVGGFNSNAFVWLNDGTPMKALGSLGGCCGRAYDINSSGKVTGWATLSGDAVSHAFVWSNDGTRMKDLNKLIDPADALKRYITLTEGAFINDRSDIVAYGTDSRTGLGGMYLLESTGVTNSALTLTPRSLGFGNLPINTSSAAQSVTVTNTSSKPVAITGIALRGTAPKQYAFTEDCGQSLAGHATCTIKVTFKPTTVGAKTAFVDVNGGGNGLRSVKLTGTGTGT